MCPQGAKPLDYTSAGEIKVFHHLQCLYLAPLPASLLFQTVSDQGLRADLFALQCELKEEKELNAKCHADLLALLAALQPKPPGS